MIRIYTLLLVVITLFTGCSLFDPPEEIPSYIHVKEFTLTTTTQEGTNSHKIEDAWVYADGQLIGAFELPATIPVLAEGITNLKIYPGILADGISITREVYPFYDFHEVDLDLTRGTIDTIQPTTTYQDGVTFVFKEDFEDVGLDLSEDAAINTGIFSTVNNSEAFESKSGLIEIKDTTLVWRVTSGATSIMNIPGGVRHAFIELNYKADLPFDVGLITDQNGTFVDDYVGSVNDTKVNGVAQWNKIYFNIKDDVGFSFPYEDFHIYFQGLGDGSEANIYIDNVKIVHF